MPNFSWTNSFTFSKLVAGTNSQTAWTARLFQLPQKQDMWAIHIKCWLSTNGTYNHIAFKIRQVSLELQHSLRSEVWNFTRSTHFPNISWHKNFHGISRLAIRLDSIYPILPRKFPHAFSQSTSQLVFLRQVTSLSTQWNSPQYFHFPLKCEIPTAQHLPLKSDSHVTVDKKTAITVFTDEVPQLFQDFFINPLTFHRQPSNFLRFLDLQLSRILLTQYSQRISVSFF